MLRQKTMRRVKRTSSPTEPALSNTISFQEPIPEPSALIESIQISPGDIPTETAPVSTQVSPSVSHQESPKESPSESPKESPKESPREKGIQRYFEAESASVLLTKPWLRLERGIRLQKFRAFAEAYPGLRADERESLFKMLTKANDAKLLNTKQQIVYENGVISAVRGLKIIRTGDPTVAAVFKIEIVRPTKKNLTD